MTVTDAVHALLDDHASDEPFDLDDSTQGIIDLVYSAVESWAELHGWVHDEATDTWKRA